MFKFVKVHERRKLKINVGKSKVINCDTLKGYVPLGENIIIGRVEKKSSSTWDQPL